MRIWDLEPSYLCSKHLLGEHRELHAVWMILTKSKKGYSRHPETIRWKGKLKALYIRHQRLVSEFEKRGYIHKSNLNKKVAVGQPTQTEFLNTIEEQIHILRDKKCECKQSPG